MMRYPLLFLILIFQIFQLHGQIDICGSVVVDKVLQHDAIVFLVGRKDTVRTDESGKFCFTNLPQGEYTLRATFVGYRSEPQKLNLDKSISKIRLEIKTPYLFDDLDVISKKTTDVKAEQSIKAEIVDLEEHKRSSTSVEQLMNNATGIKVRNNGGLGAESDIIVGGYNGKSVKFLIDGIPMDYLGSSMSITKIPTNMAHHIEIYKGVMPPEIGIDALGAAINIVTKPPTNTNTKVSYEFGSFNTHRLSLNSFVRSSEKFSFGVNAFANYSDNNFKVDDLPLDNETTGKTEYITAKLFHNGYKQVSGEVFVNIEKQKWADLLKISVNSYGLQKQIQNDMSSRARPYGGALRNEHTTVIPSLLYKKNFWDNKFQLSQFLVFSSINYALVDSVKDAYYDWEGNRHATISGTEMGTDMSNLTEPIIRTTINNFTYRGLFTYRFSDKHKLVLNAVENFLYRIADDLSEYDSKSYVTYNRFIAALGYQYKLWDERIEGLTQVKFMNSYTQGVVDDEFEIGEEEELSTVNFGTSLAQSIKYQSKNGWMARASAENTYRLPDQLEIFGDNVFILPNLKLKPETSLNINVSLGYRHKKYYKVEVSSYYRNTKDMIRLKELTQFRSMFLNLDKVRGYGIELEASVYPVERLEISGNLTYNEFRFKGSKDNISQNDHFMDARVSNMPFYFGNARISYEFKKLFTEKDKIKLYWTYSYVHQYYLDFIEKQFEPDGVLGIYGKSKIYTDRVIPIQHVNSAGFVWWIKLTEKEHILAFSAEINNMFNKPVYNNFRMQSAGRNFSMKLSYEF